MYRKAVVAHNMANARAIFRNVFLCIYERFIRLDYVCNEIWEKEPEDERANALYYGFAHGIGSIGSKDVLSL